MSIHDLFQNPSQSILSLPTKPKVFWYASAGQDFRGPVFLTDSHLSHEEEHHGRILEKPELFIYTCLGDETEELQAQLKAGPSLLYEDAMTKVSGRNYEALSLKEDLDWGIKPGRINFVPEEMDAERTFLFELVIESNGSMEVKKVLYLKQENLQAFDQVVLGGYCEVTYLCATREGMGFGNCRKSIIQHIYEDGAPDFFQSRGFKPSYAIVFKDFTHDVFKDALQGSDEIRATENYVDFIQEHHGHDSDYRDNTFYKLEYLK